MPEPANIGQGPEKFKVVIFMDDEVESGASKIIDHVNNQELKDVLVLTGSMGDIELSALQGRTDENTMFIVLAHGGNQKEEDKDGNNVYLHWLDNIKTGVFFDNLKIAVKGHKISSVLFSCHGGSVIKRNEISDGITLMTISGNKYPSLEMYYIDGILKILEWKIKKGFSNQRIYQELPSSSPETIYYGDEEKSYKFPRVGKFDIKEIKEILPSYDFKIKEAKSIIEILEKSGKKYFNIRSIQKQLNDEIDRTIALKKYKDFIRILEENLREKISPESIKNFIRNRRLVESKEAVATEEISDDQVQDYVHSVLALAVSDRKDIDLVRAIKRVYGKSIIDKIDSEGLCSLLRAVYEGNKEIVIELLKDASNVNICDSYGNTALLHALFNKHNEIAKILVNNYGADVSVANKDGVTALMTAVRNNDKEMVRLLIEKENNDSDMVKTRIDPLLTAVIYGREEIVEIIADDKRTPLENIDELLEIAKNNNYPRIVSILKSAHIQKFKKNTTKIIESKKNDQSFESQKPKTTISKSNKAVRIKIKSDKEIF